MKKHNVFVLSVTVLLVFVVIVACSDDVADQTVDVNRSGHAVDGPQNIMAGNEVYILCSAGVPFYVKNTITGQTTYVPSVTQTASIGDCSGETISAHWFGNFCSCTKPGLFNGDKGIRYWIYTNSSPNRLVYTNLDNGGNPDIVASFNSSTSTFSTYVCQLGNGSEAYVESVYPPLSVTISSVACVPSKGTSATLTAVPSGGAGSYSYYWTPGGFTSQSITRPISSCPTTFSVTVTSGNQTANAARSIYFRNPSYCNCGDTEY